MIRDPQEKQAVARMILEALPDWFGIPEARENYIREMWYYETQGNHLCVRRNPHGRIYKQSH